MQSLANTLQNKAQALVQTVRPCVKADIPTYMGYHDCKSANEYLDRLPHYQQTTALSDAKLFERMVPMLLTEQAARWFQIGHHTRTVEEFCASFRGGEFRPANYEWRLRRKSELHTQHLDKSMLEYVRAIDELYRLANHHSTTPKSRER
ncbi:hypothetical protein HPB51_025627 [Rhipicephalus microplus]|uniref:Retrotransposon gag domain-containing protein n=1 Tax=Rhipicephalus microplus TaxID=6941 RepID=A0A9J6DRU4_RHIMP|nr:hypothetical protein HPB51_025627 [Rhipicephalus microplus]